MALYDEEQERAVTQLLRGALSSLYPDEDAAFLSTAKLRRASRPNCYDEYHAMTCVTLFKRYPLERLQNPSHYQQESASAVQLGRYCNG